MMSLGMNGEDLKKFFEKEYAETQANRYKLDYPRIERDYTAQGIPKNEAKLLALSQIQSVAIAQTVVKAIYMNNVLIESQLREKGFTF